MAEKTKNKYTYLLKNFGLLTISNFGSKILSLILIPIYTSILTTEEYGNYDLFTNTIGLIIPILTIDIVTSVLRFSLDNTKDKKSIFSYGMKINLGATILVLLFCAINYFFNFIPLFKQYTLYFFLLFLSTLIYNYLSSFARGIEKIKLISIAGIINTIVMLAGNILFLVVFKIGLNGYFIANILAYFIPSVFLFVFSKGWTYITFHKTDRELKIEMKKYSIPLIFNEVCWWVTNVSDRYVVTWLKGVAENGIYSVAYKIPSLLNVVQSIFSSAWTLSSVKEYDDETKSEFYSEIYAIYNVAMVLICSCLLVANRLIAKILFANEFFTAWQYSPYLMLSTLFGALSGYVGGIYSAAKNTKIISISTVVGALLNIGLNILLVNYIGTVGAAIATLISYIVVWVIRMICLRKIVLLKINYIKHIISYVLLLAQCIIWSCNLNNIVLYSVEGAILIVVCIMYFKDIKLLILKFVSLIKNRTKKEKSAI